MKSIPTLPDWLIGELGDPGVSIDSSRVYFSRRSRAAWSVYLIMAAAVEPAIIDSLLTGNGNRQHWSGWKYRLDPIASDSPPADHLFAAHDSGRFADDDLEGHIVEWCGRWGFKRWFAEIPAHNTIGAAVIGASEGKPPPNNFVCDARGAPLQDDDRSDVFRSTRVFRVIRVELDPSLPVFEWDPTQESRAEARVRIMDHLRSEVEAELDRIQDEFMASGYQPVPSRRVSGEQIAAELWYFARYRIGGGSMADIERDIANGETWRSAESIHKKVLRALERSERLLGISRR